VWGEKTDNNLPGISDALNQTKLKRKEVFRRSLEKKDEGWAKALIAIIQMKKRAGPAKKKKHPPQVAGIKEETRKLKLRSKIWREGTKIHEVKGAKEKKWKGQKGPGRT